MNRQHSWSSLIKETVILTAAVAIIAAAVYFFLLLLSCTLSIAFPVSVLCFPTLSLFRFPAITMILNGAPHHRILYLRQRIPEQRPYTTSVMLPLFLGLFEKAFPAIGFDRQPGAGCTLLYSGGQHRLKHSV